jgi:Tol biopolymer transport system component
MLKRLIAAAGMLAVGGAILAAPASATFPGVNGPITYHKVGVFGTEIFKLDSGLETQLTTSAPGLALDSDWSPDGTKIAFDSDRDGLSTNLYVMDADGGNVVELIDDDGFDGFPSWSPDGSRIAWDHQGENEPVTQGIWTMAADGSDRVQVTSPARGFDSEPAYSPDGRWIAFTRFRPTCKEPNRNHFVSAACMSAIMRVRTDGSGLRRLTAWGQSVASPDWSPDGAAITFHRGDDGAQGGKLDVYAMAADGSHERALTDSPPFVVPGPFVGSGNPVYSPDGQRIMFTRWFADKRPQIMVMDADGSRVEAVTDEPDVRHNEADWGTQAAIIGG